MSLSIHRKVRNCVLETLNKMEEQIPQKKFFLTVLVGCAGLIGLALLFHYLATHGGETQTFQGKLLSRLDGSPVAGATLYASKTPVFVLSREAGGKEPVILGGTDAAALRPLSKSAADGSFQFEAPAASGASLLAVHSELAAALKRSTGDDAPFELYLDSPCSLEGEVYDDHGNTLKGALISLVPFGALEKPRWQTWSDALGKFQFERLPVGRLTVSVLFPPLSGSPNSEFGASAVVRVGARDRSLIHFGPSGAVLGKVKDAKGNLIRNAQLEFRSPGLTAEGRIAAQLRCKSMAEYRLYALPARVYRVFVRNPDPEDMPQWFDGGDLRLPREGEKYSDIELSPIRVQIRIAPDSAVDYPFPERLASVSRPPKRRLLVFPQGASQPSYELTDAMKVSTDGSRGVYDPKFSIFHIRCLPAGKYTLVAQVEGYGAGVEEEFVVKLGQDEKPHGLYLTRGGPVTVAVKDSKGKTIPNAIVSIWLEDRFEIVRGGSDEPLHPGPGTFTLRVEADGYKTKSEQFHILVASKKSLEVVLEPE